jgi:type III pantothenate kinase
MTASDFLLIDVSNSFTKVALSTRACVGQRRKIATARLTAGSFQKLVRGWKFHTAVLSSVVPQKNRLIRSSLKSRLLIVGPALNLGVGIDFPNPKTIGADRLANAAAVVHLYGAPAVVVDFGTAVTFDVISPGRKYVGGVIAPGLEVMTDYFYQRTALLPKINLLEPVAAIGKSTRAAMLSGAVHGYRGLVERILAEIRREISPGKKIRVIATGGYAELIAAKLPEIDKVNPLLTLDGLRIIGNLNA